MRLISYQPADATGAERPVFWGVLQPDGKDAKFVDGMDLTEGRIASVRQLLRQEGLHGLRHDLLLWSGPWRALSEVVLAPPVPDPAKILAVGLNYAAHRAETGNVSSPAPVFFSRFTDNLLGHKGLMPHPGVSEQFDYEGELAVVIGRSGRHIAVGEAMNHVVGYACFNDGSVRDLQRESITAGKSFPATAPFGPWLVTVDELPQLADLRLRTRVNGITVQAAALSEMMHSVAELIAYASRFTPLAAGDVIATGTPAGIGARRVPPLWLCIGDVVEVEIEGLGVLRNTVGPSA